MHVIEIQELTKIYQTGLKKGNIVALDSVSLDVEMGEIFGLLGPNGAGKTTLLKVILNITQITSGQVLVLGLPPNNPESRQKVGYLPENHRFPTHLTGLGLLEFTGRLYGLTEKEIDSRTEKLLALVGMERWGNTKIRKYSKGMSQRIGLAQAMVSDPEILLLDEPTDGVDPIGKIEIRKVMERIKQEGKTVFLNSHLLSEVESVADRVAILSRGRVARIGTVESLTSRKSQYEIEAAIGNEIFEIPEDIGKRISLSAVGMIIELKNDEDINYIIDQLRMRHIKIKSIKPMKISLEQSFFETVTENKEPAS